MARESLTVSECLSIIEYVSDALTNKGTESAVSDIIEKLRVSFGVSCVSIREICPRPCSLRYTYESLNDPTKVKRINETITFDEDVWEGVMENFSHGCYVYKAGGDQSAPKFIGRVPNAPMCMIQVPMYSGRDFVGVLDLVDFDEIRDWSEGEISALTVCANFICHYLYKLNLTLTETRTGNGKDPITGFMSFSAFTEMLDEKLLEMLDGSPIAVVYMDIHHFKLINETYGYRKGDELLKIASRAIYEGASKHAEIIICRAHADYFVTAANVPEKAIPFFDKFVQEINEEVCRLLHESCPDVRIRVNTGICYVRDPKTTAATAIAHANLARKTAKKANMTKPLVFSDEMMEEIKYHEYLTNELPKAIRNHDLKVYYQPKVNCSDDTLYGAEALVRWQKPDGSFIYPDQFIPVFEKNGNIEDVDFYVYRQVFKYIRGRLDAGLPVFPISMNVSRVHFQQDNIVPYIKSLFDEFDVPPNLVDFELTENIYMNNFDRADSLIKYCRDNGIKVSMDDFGSGYSSLNVISSLSIDTLKIDKIFLKHAELDDNDKAVIESIIAMAKRLGMKVICEGVETEAQTEFLKEAKCDQIQGYYYGRPMDEESFNRFVAEHIVR
ncbi:MAG: EAL domain-containing protein [Oscillospiraceae bacterium]|nr:EAL domain-containing protein [Oscillospiraceae bacterium]